MWPLSYWLVPLIYMDMIAETYTLTWGPLAKFWLGDGTNFRDWYRQNMELFDGRVAQW